MDWELIFWVVGGISALLFLGAALIIGSRCGDELERDDDYNPNIDRWEDDWG